MTDEAINLFCVVGVSPAVVTETVYSLCVIDDEDNPAATIERIQALTTTVGRDKLEPAVYQQLDAMARSYPEAADRIPTDEDVVDVQVAHRPDDDSELADVRDAADSAAMADAIFDRVRSMTGPDDPRLIVSMAGGRKTMGYFAGNALMFFGRDGDRLTHILAGENAERSPDFYYPTAKSTPMQTYDGSEFDAANEMVELHEIPFIRLSDKVSGQLPHSFADLIESMQRTLSGPPKLEVNLRSGIVRFRGVKLPLSPVPRTLFIVLAVEHKRGRTPVSTRDLVDIDADNLLTELNVVFEHIDGGDNAFFIGTHSDFRGENFEGKRDNVRENKRIIKKTIKRKASEFEASLIIPRDKHRQGYTFELDPEYIEIIGEQNYPD